MRVTSVTILVFSELVRYLNSFDGKVMQKEDTILVSVQTTLSCQLIPELKYCIQLTLLVF